MGADLINVLIVVISATLASIPAIISAFISRKSTKEALQNEAKKVNGEYTEDVASSYGRLVGDLREELNRMRKVYDDDILKLRKDLDKQIEINIKNVREIGKLKKGIVILTDQLEKLKIKPAFVLEAE